MSSCLFSFGVSVLHYVRSVAPHRLKTPRHASTLELQTSAEAFHPLQLADIQHMYSSEDVLSIPRAW
jgi:hypothetical protein